MTASIDMIRSIYGSLEDKIDNAKKIIGRPLTLAEKILYSHLWEEPDREYGRGKDYVELSPDRVAMQDATAQMALLQFMHAGKAKTAEKPHHHPGDRFDCQDQCQRGRGCNRRGHR